MAGVQSIERAFALLRALSRQPGGVTALAERLDLPKSTVARLLGALETEGAVEQVEAGGEYSLGPALGELAPTQTDHRNLIAIARPWLVELSERTGEACGINTLVGRQVHFLDQVASEHDVQVRDWTGESGEAHALPAGLAILANSPPSVVDAYLAEELDALTPSTMTDPDELLARLGQVRSAGYVWVFEEFAPGINSVAAAVHGLDGVVGAIHIHGPTFRFPNPNRTHDIGLQVVEVAEGISAQLAAVAAGSVEHQAPQQPD